MVETYAASDIVRSSLLTLWTNVAGFAPRLIAAIIIFLVGWIIAHLIGKLVWHIVRGIRLDAGLSKVGFKNAWERSGFALNTPKFFYALVKWFIVIGFLMAATNILGLDEVTEFLRTVVFYLPHVFVAAIIMLIGIMVAKFVEGSVRASVRTAGLASANFLGSLSKWAVVVFAFLIALSQLKVAPEVINILVMGLVAALALAFGLAFGLGGTRHADEVLNHLKRKMGDHQ